MDYFLARYYSSAQGRFTSPAEFVGGPDDLFDVANASDNTTFYADLMNPQTLNKYQYCNNNPLGYVDPDGHQSKWAEAQKARAEAYKTLWTSILEFREKARRFLGTDRESNVSRGIESGLTREQAESSADMAEAFNDQAALGGGITKIGAQALERLAVQELEKRFVVTLGREISKTNAMADIVAIAKSGKSAVVQEVTTGAKKSVSLIREQLEAGFDHAVKQGIAGDKIKLIVRVTDRKLASKLGKKLATVRDAPVKIILE